MIKEYYGGIKVSKSIKPLLKSERTQPPLQIDSSYYISFDLNNACPCYLINVFDEKETKYVEVKILHKANKATLSSNHIVKAICIGTTPEQAIENQVF